MSNFTIYKKVASAKDQPFPWSKPGHRSGRVFMIVLHTVYDSTNDLMYLPIPNTACESSSKSWSELAAYGLEGASSCCWP